MEIKGDKTGEQQNCVPATVNILMAKNKKTVCPWRIFAGRIEAGSGLDMRSTG